MATKAELEKEVQDLHEKIAEFTPAWAGFTVGIVLSFLLGLFLYGSVLPHGNTNVTFKLEDVGSEFGSQYLGKYRVCREEKGDFSETSCGIMEEYGSALSDLNQRIVREEKGTLEITLPTGKVGQCLSSFNGVYYYSDCGGKK